MVTTMQSYWIHAADGETVLERRESPVPAPSECIRSMAFQGRLATVGYVDGVLKGDMDIEALHGKRLTLFGVSNKLRNAGQRAVTVRGMVADILPAIADGRIKPVIDRVYAFDELPAAKEYMESNAHLGKIVVRMDDSASA